MSNQLEGRTFSTPALHIVQCVWEKVSESTIRKCFAKAKFIKEEYQTEPDNAELLEIWEALPAKEKKYKNEEIELSDFLRADGQQGAGGKQR